MLEEATGLPLAELISMHIWKPMGAEFDAFITVDESGFVLADHGMNSTLRDLGRVGLLVLNKGKAFGEQVVPADFIEDMHAQPGDKNWPYESSEGLEPYYRSFWWGEGNDEHPPSFDGGLGFQSSDSFPLWWRPSLVASARGKLRKACTGDATPNSRTAREPPRSARGFPRYFVDYAKSSR